MGAMAEEVLKNLQELLVMLPVSRSGVEGLCVSRDDQIVPLNVSLLLL